MKNVTSKVNLALEKQLTTSGGRVMVHSKKKARGSIVVAASSALFLLG